MFGKPRSCSPCPTRTQPCCLSPLRYVQHELTTLQIKKVFDIACCYTDVVACDSFSPDTFALGHRDYVSRFLTFISALRGGQSRYLLLLLAKLSKDTPDS
jgi:hypothetical protein